MRVVFLAIVAAGCAAAQPIGFGLKLGAPLNDALHLASGTGSLADTATRFTLGPMVDLRLPFGVGVEADLLYRRVGGTYLTPLYSADVRGNQWDLPVLLKYRFGFPIVKPYVEAGPTFTWITNVGGLSAIGPDVSVKESGKGLTLGAGVEVKLLVIRIAPELRYTRWGSGAFSVQSATSTLLHANQNQAEFLVGISF